MKERIREIFNLEWIKNFAEANIDQTEWIEEECGEKRKILEVVTLFDGANGAYIPGMVLELFGKTEGDAYDELMFLENEVNQCLNELLPSKGTYYMGYHEYDGSYCLFYEEYEEEQV